MVTKARFVAILAAATMFTACGRDSADERASDSQEIGDAETAKAELTAVDFSESRLLGDCTTAWDLLSSESKLSYGTSTMPGYFCARPEPDDHGCVEAIESFEVSDAVLTEWDGSEGSVDIQTSSHTWVPDLPGASCPPDQIWLGPDDVKVTQEEGGWVVVQSCKSQTRLNNGGFCP